MSHHKLEEGKELGLDFSKLEKIAEAGNAVVPVVVQDAETGEVLILAYANKDALQFSLTEGYAVFWSTSRQELWRKGATSGSRLKMVEIRVNCEQNSLLYRVIRENDAGSCHTKKADGSYRMGCYYRRLVDANRLEFVEEQ